MLILKLRSLRIALVAGLVVGCSTLALAKEVAMGFNCPASASPEKIVKAFIQGAAVQTKAYDNTDAVQSFAAKAGFTAFSFPLVAVVAWEDNSQFFGRGPGTAPPVHFAMVVQGQVWEVRNAVRKAGIKLLGRTNADSYPQVQVSAFNSDSQDPLPATVNPSLALTRIACHPRL